MTATIAAPSLARLCSTFADSVATARQLVAAGVHERTVYRRCLEGGPWHRALPGVIFLFTGRPTRRQYVRAALLLGGEGAVLTGIEACRILGLRRGPARRPDPPDDAEDVHVLIPHDRQVRSVGFVHVERTSHLPEPLVRDGLPVAPLTRACIDASRRIRSRGDVTELLSDAVQRSLCTVAALVSEVEVCSRRGTAVPRQVLREVADGVRSAAELQAKALWEKARLPAARWNVDVRRADGELVGRADCWVDEVALVWETESTEWHLSPAAHDYTVERATRFTAAGAVYLATKPRRLRTSSQEVVADLRAAYEQAKRRPRPGLFADPPPP